MNLLQGVDEQDRETGALREEDLDSSIHRRVAILIVDENDQILHRSGEVPNKAVAYRCSSKSSAQEVMEELQLSGELVPLGGLLRMQNKRSSLTHLFLLRWSGSDPSHGPWERSPLPIEGDGAYHDFINRALRPGAYRPLHIREDLRS